MLRSSCATTASVWHRAPRQHIALPSRQASQDHLSAPVVSPQIVRQEALISDARKPQLRKLIYKLIEKQVGSTA